jgi:hypothetical protein
MRLRLCLSNAASFAALAEHYRSQAQMCRQMALATINPFKEGWLEFVLPSERLPYCWRRDARSKDCFERDALAVAQKFVPYERASRSFPLQSASR